MTDVAGEMSQVLESYEKTNGGKKIHTVYVYGNGLIYSYNDDEADSTTTNNKVQDLSSDKSSDKDTDGTTYYHYNNIGSKLEQMEKTINSISNISKDQIDSLGIYPFQPWPLYADFYINRPENPERGCKVLSDFGVTVWDENPDTHEYDWFDTPVTDGVMYLCASNLHIYQRDEESKRWIDLGSYKNN